MNPNNPQGFDWHLIRSFLAALDAGSLMGAARALSTSQPTLGRHIAELESQLGLTLIERTGRGLIATASALQLEVPARAMAAGALQMARSVSGAQARVVRQRRRHLRARPGLADDAPARIAKSMRCGQAKTAPSAQNQNGILHRFTPTS